MKPKILQIFSRYLKPGGEERVTQLIETSLADRFEIDTYFGSTEQMLGTSWQSRVLAPFRAIHNSRAAKDLEQLQKEKRYSLWLIHNVLPGLSPSVYETAFKLGLPVVHYLHNFRLMCANGFLLNHGEPCTRCLDGNFWHAFTTACWRRSRIASGTMGLVIWRIRSLRTFERITAWVALNTQQKQMHTAVGIPAERIHIVPNFVESAAVVPMPNPGGDVLFLGRLSQEKGLDHLIKAWSRVRVSTRRLLIAGTGAERDHLQALADGLGLRNVDFLGAVPREQHAELWRRTAISVIPSLWHEPFPLAMLESWTNMRGIIAPRLGCFGENVRHADDGLLYEPYSIDSLAHTLQQALDDQSLIESLGRHGRNRIELDFNRELWAARISSVIDEALAPT